jgi:AcrR family transcriptional regulator
MGSGKAPVRRSALRSKETRDAILTAASKLFSKKGYHDVTMRQIAVEAACSHTAIYQYFASKEVLLFELSAPHLEKLRRALETVRDNPDIEHRGRISQVGLTFVSFGLEHRTLMRVLVQVEASRVDEVSPVSRINEFRLSIFAIIKSVLADALSLTADDERLLVFSRTFFYLLEGIVMTYELSKESSKELLKRLRPTFMAGFDACLSGFRAELRR